jgi:uncharacterized protein (DUF2252 family)
MDVKEAVQASAPRYPKVKMPRDNAERVVEGAQHLSPHLGERMMAARLMERSVFLRELLPQDLKLEIDQLTREEAMKAARFLALVVGPKAGLLFHADFHTIAYPSSERFAERRGHQQTLTDSWRIQPQ